MLSTDSYLLGSSAAVQQVLEGFSILAGLVREEVWPWLVRDAGPEQPDPALQEPDSEVLHFWTRVAGALAGLSHVYPVFHSLQLAVTENKSSTFKGFKNTFGHTENSMAVLFLNIHGILSKICIS